MQYILITWVAAEALSGWLGDKYGSALIGCAAVLLSLPWFGLITIEGTLAKFLAFFALESKHELGALTCYLLTAIVLLVFFASGLVPIMMLELSSVGREVEMVGCTSSPISSATKLTAVSRCARLWSSYPCIRHWNDRLVGMIGLDLVSTHFL